MSADTPMASSLGQSENIRISGETHPRGRAEGTPAEGKTQVRGPVKSKNKLFLEKLTSHSVQGKPLQ